MDLGPVITRNQIHPGASRYPPDTPRCTQGKLVASGCIRVRPCASMCIHVHFMCMHVHACACMCTHVHACAPHVHACASVCIHVHRMCTACALRVHPCAPMCSRCTSRCIQMQPGATRCNWFPLCASGCIWWVPRCTWVYLVACDYGTEVQYSKPP